MDNKSESCCGNNGGFCCPLTGFQFFFNKAFIFAAIIMIVWVNLFSCYWHGFYMSAMYQATASLWRPQAEMLVGMLHGGLTLCAIMSAYIFMKGRECGGGWRQGVRFGIVVTLFLSGMLMVAHATQPIPQEIILNWALGDLIMYSVGGILMGRAFDRFRSCCK